MTLAGRTRDELLMQAPAIVAVLRGPEHVFELVNPACQALFRGRQLLGRRMRDAVPEIVSQRFLGILDRVYHTGEPYTAREARVMLDRRGDGLLDQSDFNCIYQPMISSSCEVDGIIVFAYEVLPEVQARQQGQEQLRDAEELCRLLVDSVEDYAIFMLDPEGRVTTWNAGAQRIKGYKSQEIVGHHFSIFYAEEDVSDGKPQRLLALARERGRVKDEGWRVRKDGTRFWADVTITAVRDAAGNLRGFAKVTRDATERKQSEEAQQALVVAQEVNRAKDEFLAMVSHELRTPLTAILGWARMLRIGRLDEETTQQALEALERSAQTQVHLIEDLLDETRIASGKLRLNMRPLDIRSVIDAALADLLPSAEVRQVSMETEMLCDGCPVVGDPVRLQQIVSNLVSNAIKFTPEKGSVQVRLLRDGSDAVIEVRDTGRGIAPDLLPNLFQRFRQGDSASSRKAGVGLGLAISKYLVEQHGGTIRASSEGEGKGATFTVRIPLTVEPASNILQRDPNRAGALADLSGIHVLVVEDESDNRKILSTVIERCGAEVRCARTGEDGLEILQQWEPEVMVCDIMLPGTDGCAFLLAARARTQAAALALTVYGSSGEEERVRSCGFDAFRQKPIEPADLVHEIARLARRTAPAA
ncbi:MAG TPA: ATP-binding protein [Thermoanaerobaculia bacterium]|nr:ATP-binding protein [Thermoanaerobaculia bacterium]